MKTTAFKAGSSHTKLSILILLVSALMPLIHPEHVQAGHEFPVPGKVTLVNFYADYCFACRMLKPVLERITADHGQNLAVVDINAQNNLDKAKEMKVTAVPVLFFYDTDGRLHLRHEGFMKEEKIRGVLEEMGLR